MSLFDLIGELRRGTPSIDKAERAMKILGWLCLAAAAMNFIIDYLGPFEEGPFDFPPEFTYLTLIGYTLLGFLFFKSARGIKQMEPWGKKTGQLAIILLLGFMIGYMAYIFQSQVIPLKGTGVSFIVTAFFIIFILQFGIPTYFGIRYLGRLPVKDGIYAAYRYSESKPMTAVTETARVKRSVPEVKYKDSPSRFGIYGTMALLVVVPLLIAFLVTDHVTDNYGGEIMGLIIFPMFLFIFFGPTIYNYFPSPFQDNRTLVASFTGGGSIFLFGGSWPFFRLLVYEDALEVRVMLHRYLIPYDKMDDLPEKIGFFTRGILIKSDLPDVPSRIRYQGFGLKKTLKVVTDARNKYLAEAS